MAYTVEIAPAAERQIRKLEAIPQRRILDKIETLKNNPRPAGVKKLSGTDLYRVRVGEFRIIYEIEDQITTVLVLKIGDRNQTFVSPPRFAPRSLYNPGRPKASITSEANACATRI